MISIFDILKSREFHFPLVLAVMLVLALATGSAVVYAAMIAAGLLSLAWESWERLRLKKWNLDYLAFIALGLSLSLGQLLPGAVVALMVAVSAALEKYGTTRAEKTLRGLFENIPKTVMRKVGQGTESVALQDVRPGDVLVVKRSEMIAIDGTLVSEKGLFNEANLTGEMEPVVYEHGTLLKGGIINVGETAELHVKGDFEHSSYRRILGLVEEGKTHPSPLGRLAERYNGYFTVFSLAVAFAAYAFSDDWTRFLAVLVIATPCPLLIAAPLSFIGGLNKAARKNIIIKGPYALELLARTKRYFFDKTGTLTLGVPHLERIELLDTRIDKDGALALAAALEWHSFHPLAKAFIEAHAVHGEEKFFAEDVEEVIGKGIFGTIAGQRYGIVKATDARDNGIVVDLLAGEHGIARFYFDDELKAGSAKVFDYLRERGYALGILTGDRKANAERIFGHFRLPIYADCSPEKKTALIQRYQKEGELVGMIGDGMNDAPALALADIGIVFSGTENSASIEAADVAILGRDAWLIRDAVHIGRRSYHVAFQSIMLGIGLSSAGMLLAAFGFIPPLQGAILQEVIDVIVIVNALRSTY
jgi:heavy metal translocating P-type ATPase